MRETAAAKRGFSVEDVVARGRQTIERCIGWGTMAMRTHVEVDPGIGMTGFEGVQQLARDYAWALDLELCVFPQEGLLNNPGTDALLVEGLRRGASVIGAVPYIDTDPRGQIDRVFELAREWGVDIDMHLDLADHTDGMQAEYVCRKTEAYGWGGRVTIGHATQISLLDRPRHDALAATLAGAGVAVTILPATDLYLMGRAADHAIPRGVVRAEPLRAAGVRCSISTNNVLNPFTPVWRRLVDPHGEPVCQRLPRGPRHRPGGLPAHDHDRERRIDAEGRLRHRGRQPGRCRPTGLQVACRRDPDVGAAALGLQGWAADVHPRQGGAPPATLRRRYTLSTPRITGTALPPIEARIAAPSRQAAA